MVIHPYLTAPAMALSVSPKSSILSRFDRIMYEFLQALLEESFHFGSLVLHLVMILVFLPDRDGSGSKNTVPKQRGPMSAFLAPGLLQVGN